MGGRVRVVVVPSGFACSIRTRSAVGATLWLTFLVSERSAPRRSCRRRMGGLCARSARGSMTPWSAPGAKASRSGCRWCPEGGRRTGEHAISLDCSFCRLVGVSVARGWLWSRHRVSYNAHDSSCAGGVEDTPSYQSMSTSYILRRNRQKIEKGARQKTPLAGMA